MGLALNLDYDSISVIILDDADRIQSGMLVFGEGEGVRVPVGPGLLGRVLDPLGRPLDDGGPVAFETHLPVERPAPAIIERALVTEPIETGVLVLDALFALGRGQRELIIGDRATGKTSIAIDAIINQKHSDVVCVYVAIGQRTTAIERAIEAVRKYGAPDRCIFLVASAAAAPGLQWLAPYAGFTMAEYFRDNGGHALIVVDDLTKHAATHRELALLTREPPGREAYPGDIFYLHARLLERAARLAPELGGGSLTALPIAETDAGNLSAYIPTNLISITDGQIVLDSRLFAANQRPAVNVGLSVSRVGGKAQRPALRQVSGRIRLDYAQFLELEMFSRFGGISDKRFRSTLTRGERIRAVLAQDRFCSLSSATQVALLAALDAGVLDKVPADVIRVARDRIGDALTAEASDLIASIDTNGILDDSALFRLARVAETLVGKLAGPEGQYG
jgi:F-type H+-transporting ATPase subunit alpha